MHTFVNIFSYDTRKLKSINQKNGQKRRGRGGEEAGKTIEKGGGKRKEDGDIEIVGEGINGGLILGR